MSNGPQSVERAVRVLLAFDGEGQDLSIGEIAALLGVHKSTASRLTAGLREHGLLERTPGGDRFRLGPEVARLGLLALAGRPLLEVAREPMEALAAATEETVTLAILDGEELTTVAQVDTPHIVGPRPWVGRSTPLHTTSDGKIFLAFGEAPLPEGPLVGPTPQTVTSRARLRRELVRIRERGWAEADGELEEGLRGVAAPVVDSDGRCLAALGVCGPVYRFTSERVNEIAQACIEVAVRIGSQLTPIDGALLGGEARAR